MKKNLYKRIDHETSCWDFDAGCRHIIANNKRTRKFRREMRKHARKCINRFLLREQELEITNF